MVWVMVLLMFPCERGYFYYEVCHHECMVYYAFLWMLVLKCGQVYNDVVVVFMHEVMVCVVDMVMH